MNQRNTWTVDELLGQAGWVRALAMRLAHEGAEDAAQETWVAAMRRAPRRQDSPRGWLAAVLLNGLRSRLRADHRRQRRERAAARNEPPATPEDAAARLEIQRTLAEVVSALPEPYRHVVYLRFVDDLEPIEIARLLGVPAGTIRWRLSEALSRLRVALDERSRGDRESWKAAVAVFGFPRRARRSPRLGEVVAAAKRSLRLGWVVVAAAGLALLFAAGVHQAGSTTQQPVRAARNGTPSAMGPPALSGSASASTSDVDDVCTANETMRAAVAEIRRVAEPIRKLGPLFEESAPSPLLEKNVASLVARQFQDVAPGCAQALSCRGVVCEVSILVPEGTEDSDCSPKKVAEMRDHLASGLSSSMSFVGHAYDAVLGKSYSRLALLWRFERQDGVKVGPHERRPVPRAGYDFSAPAPSRPRDLPEICRSQWSKLAAELEDTRHHVMTFDPEAAFAASAPNDRLTKRVSDWARGSFHARAGHRPSTSRAGPACAP